MFFFFKQKTAYELCISDWSSDVCSSDLRLLTFLRLHCATSMSSMMMQPCDSSTSRNKAMIMELLPGINEQVAATKGTRSENTFGRMKMSSKIKYPSRCGNRKSVG